MGKFKQLDQERQESAISDLENWKKTDKFEVGLIDPRKTKLFVKWLKKNGHSVIITEYWIAINGISFNEDTTVRDIFNFLIGEYKNEKNN
ncbi:MAG: hypothetical protein ABW166_19360 [Sedimenticola sp.]